MKPWPLLFATLFLSSCQCHREPDADAPQTAGAAAIGAKKTTPSAPAEDAATLQANHAQAQAFAAAVSTVHSYLAALPRGEQGDANTFWTGGRPSPVPDDANLREIQGLDSMRIQTSVPTALDRELPTRAVEVPVTLTARTAQGTRHFSGWYRLRPRVDGSGWEITSASLQPALD